MQMPKHELFSEYTEKTQNLTLEKLSKEATRLELSRKADVIVSASFSAFVGVQVN